MGGAGRLRLRVDFAEPKCRWIEEVLSDSEFDIAGESGAGFNVAIEAAEPDREPVFSPLPIDAAESGHDAVDAEWLFEPGFGNAGADEEERLRAGLVEADEHIELEKEHFGGRPVVGCDVRRCNPAADGFPSSEAVFLAIAFPPGVETWGSLIIPEPVEIFPDEVSSAEGQPLMCLGEGEIGPKWPNLEGIFVVVSEGTALSELVLISMVIGDDPGGV
jgi:hypothetical protein